MLIYVYIYMYVYMYIHVYIYVNTYIHTHTEYQDTSEILQVWFQKKRNKTNISIK